MSPFGSGVYCRTFILDELPAIYDTGHIIDCGTGKS
jgi:hypothetical protein